MKIVSKCFPKHVNRYVAENAVFADA